MNTATADRGTTCPSAPPEPGAMLFGIIAGKGEVVYISPNIPLNPGLLDGFAQSGMPLENRLRFASPCLQHRCVQWTGNRCGLIDRAVEGSAPDETDATLPKCGIRSTCRWFAQHGRTACAACPEVIRKPAGA